MQLYSAPADRNKEPILEVISELLLGSKKVLEIGSGTGQHALFFAEKMPHLVWIPSDLAENVPVLNAQFELNPRPNIHSPVALDVISRPWILPEEHNSPDLIYSTNTLHIVSWGKVEAFFSEVGEVLAEGGYLVIYGPFKYAGKFTSESNAKFDDWLKQRDSLSGIRDFEAVNRLAVQQGLALVEDYAMPANNQCLIWKR